MDNGAVRWQISKPINVIFTDASAKMAASAMLVEDLTLTIANALAVSRYLMVFCWTDYGQIHVSLSRRFPLLRCNPIDGP